MQTTRVMAAVAALLIAAPAAAQWRNLPKDVPAGPDGKPNLSAPAPRVKTSSGSDRVDLSGIYSSSYKYFANLAADVGLDKVPMTDEARKIQAARATGSSATKNPTHAACRRASRRSTWRPCPSRSSRRKSSSSSSTKRSTCGGRCSSTTASSPLI